MKLRVLWVACFFFLSAVSVLAQTLAARDVVSGNWGDPSAAGFDLKFDGKRTVTGSIRVVGGGKMTRPAIKTGTFDPQTGVLRLEGDGEGPDGSAAHFVIEGKIDKDKVSGTFSIGGNKGDFTFERGKTPGQTATDRWIQ